MDNKRKANSSLGAGAGDGDDRAGKRRKVSLMHEYDLNAGESSDSTTAYGLAFLEQLRQTKDKNGRLVATYFLRLPRREGNEDYYDKTRMPIALDTVERKLRNHAFNNMSELESYFKRMIDNAKKYYSRGHDVYDDAERVRKAISNYMTKTNPAYKNSNYQAVPTPLPLEPEPLPELDEADRDAEGEEDDAGQNGVEGEGEEEENDDEEEDEDEEENEEDEEDEDEEEDEDDEDDPNPLPVVSKRRGPGRPPKDPALHAQKVAKRAASAHTKADMQYEGVPYKGLTFQQAQEKIVEEMIRKKEEEDDWQYFEPFLNLPSRTLKDYYQIIKEPFSLRKLQKMVKGVRGKREMTGVSAFKSWAAFEQTTKLLWENAFEYNEDGSQISDLANELRDFFEGEVGKAKAHVQVPPQPKIKIKDKDSGVLSRKVTIHVGGNRGSSTDTPAPTTARSGDSADEGTNGTAKRNPLLTSAASELPQVEKARSTSIASPSPSMGGAVKREELQGRNSPAGPIRANGSAVSSFNSSLGVPPAPVNGPPPPHPVVPVQNGLGRNTGNAQLPFDSKYRPAGKGVADALIQNLCIKAHPNIDRNFRVDIPPHPFEAQQSISLNLPATHWRLQIFPKLSAHLEAQQRQYKLFVINNGMTLPRSQFPPTEPPLEPYVQFFEAQLHPGVNNLQVQLIAALPKGERLPSGADVELEKITILANLVKY